MFNCLRQVFGRHPISLAIYLSPPLVFLATCVFKDYLCNLELRLNPNLGLWISIGWLCVVCALVQLDRDFCSEVTGKDPPFGTELFALIFFGLNINGMLVAPIGLLYLMSKIAFRTPCG